MVRLSKQCWSVVLPASSGALRRKNAIEVLSGEHRVLAATRESGGQTWCATAGGGLFAASADSLPMRPFLHHFGGGAFSCILRDKQVLSGLVQRTVPLQT